MERFIKEKKTIVFLAALCILTAIIYYGMLKYPVLSNDDTDYFTKYPEIVNLTFKHVITYFTSYYVLMYQPIPVLTFAINYHFTGTSPFALHLVNLIFHLVNIPLVFILFRSLFTKPLPALIIAFLFALHPMNVEAVTWISARSSSMYTCFYLLSLIFYVKYISNKLQAYALFISFCFFILSLLCKAQAVTLPVLLFFIDYFSDRKRDKKFLIDKIPFILMSIVFISIALGNPLTQTYITKGRIQSFSAFDLVFLNGRALFFYLQKMLVPVNLSAVYVFPVKSGSWLPIEYYILTIPVIILLLIVFKFRKNKKLVLGVGIFLVSISINLPLISSRSIIYADRYAYFPYLGLYVIIALFFETLSVKYPDVNRKSVYSVLLLIFLFGLFCSFETLERNKVWENDMTLASDIIRKNPPVPFLAKIFRKRGDYSARHQAPEEAIKDYSSAIDLDPGDVDSYIYRAYAYIKIGKQEEALPDFNKAIGFRPTVAVLYANRAMIELNTGDLSRAWNDCNQCLSLDSSNAEVYNYRAIIRFRSGDLEGAQKDLRSAIRYNRNYAEAYKNLGMISFQLKNTLEAYRLWQIAARLGDQQAAQLLKEFKM
jgi:protein O-mannosyl-transferase